MRTSLCPLSLLYKGHKGWSPDEGTRPPPTQPVAGGHLGINLHISEIVSDLLDPVVTTYEGGREIISTEDMVARIEIKNDENTGWSRSSYWRGMRFEEYRACEVCIGTEGYVWNEDDPELCGCDDDRDGIDDDGCVLITSDAMRELKITKWKTSSAGSATLGDTS